MRKLALLVVLASCATTQPVQKLPCEDGDAARCLDFVKFIETATQRDGKLANTLERYCLEGSLESCQRLAKIRKDTSLDRLCQDGIAEACAIPNDKRSPELLASECEQGLPGACRTSFARSGLEKATVLALEHGCTEGIAASCFALSQRLDAQSAERAKKLAWRSCLAGIEAACLGSDIGATKCAQGTDSACKAFLLGRNDDEATKTRKIAVLKPACAHKVDNACVSLVSAVPHPELLELACEDFQSCHAVISMFEADEVLGLCRESKGKRQDAACNSLLRSIYREDPLPEFVGAWAQAACKSAKDDRPEHCRPWMSVLEHSGRHLEALRVQCEVAECTDKDSLALVDRCLAGEKGDACARAGLWLRQERLSSGSDLEVQRKVLSLACAGNEALSCIEAAKTEKNATARLSLLETGCRAGSKQACTDAGRLSLAKRECDGGKCSEWARAFSTSYYGDLPPEALALVERTCAKGTKEDCLEWSESASPSLRVRKCVEQQAFCPPFGKGQKGDAEFMKALHPKLAASLKTCDSGDGKGCGELLKLMQSTGYFTPIERTVDEAVFGWAKSACEVGQMCGVLVDALRLRLKSEENELAQLSAMTKACVAGEAPRCGEQARLVWARAGATRFDRLERAQTFDAFTPEFKHALAMALRGCELGDSRSCTVAADFVETGLGVKADPLEAERIRARARDELFR